MGSCFQGTPKEVFLVLPACWCPLSMHGEIAGKPKVENQNEESVRQIRLSRRTRETQVFKLPLKVSHSGATLLEVAMKPVQQVFLAFFFSASASAAGLTSTTTTARLAATLEAKVNTSTPVAPKTKETTNSTESTANSSEIISNTIASNSTNEAPVDKTTQTSKTTNSNSIVPAFEPTTSNATNSNSPNEEPSTPPQTTTNPATTTKAPSKPTTTPPPTTITPMPCTATSSSSSPALAFFAGVFMVVLLEVLVFALMRWYQRRKFLRYHNFSSNVGDSFSVS